MPDHPVVGRDAVIETVWRHVSRAPECYVLDVEGVEGTGKSRLIEVVHARVREQAGYSAAWLSMDGVEPPGEATGVGALLQSLDAYRRILSSMAEQVGGPLGRFPAMAEERLLETSRELLGREAERVHVSINTGSVHIGAFARLGNSMTVNTGVDAGAIAERVALQVPQGDLLLALSRLRELLTNEFLEGRSRSDRRLAVFVDDFHRVLEADLGRWLLGDLAPRLENTVFTVARSESLTELPGPSNRVVRVQLGNLDAEEVGVYLRSRFAREDIDPALIRRIVEFSGGHPRALSLAGDLIASHGLDEPDVITIFEALPRDHAEQLRALVERFMDDLRDPTLRLAVEVGAVARRLDGDLLRHLMTGEDGPQADARPYSDLVRRLREYSFTEQVGRKFRFHQFVRRTIQARLAEESPTRLAELHRRAAMHHRGWLLRCEEDERGATPYECWYRYERPDWLESIAEWLYHLGHLGDAHAARIEFARVYFDAFWWWGNYLEYEFCERLLTEWGRTRTSREDREWLRLLRKFHEGYPTGYHKRGQGDWQHVEEALRSLRRTGRFAGPLERLGREPELPLSHLRAITNLFLAESYGYRKVEDRRADALYAEALEIFEAAGDGWNAAWTHALLADLQSDRSRLEEAAAECDRASEALAASGDEDHELLAIIQRIRGDVHWQLGELEQSFDRYCGAVFHAYAFQALPHHPDFYTAAFYDEMRQRTLERIAALRDSGQDAASVCARLRGFWEPYRDRAGDDGEPDFAALLAGTADALALALFPPPPGPDELGVGSDYADRAAAVVEEMREALLWEART